MEMDVVWLSRLQFAVTVFFHFIFVPLTLGLSVLVALMETFYVKTGNEEWRRQAKFWGKLFILNFALGVVTGITLEFQFGTNWSRYSEYVGNIFGSLLAIEATVAFFLESTFIGVWHFGWDKVSPKVHAIAIWLVAIASNLSAIWIILANGFMQNPVGYEIEGGVAVLSSFTEVISNPYAWGIFFHNMSAAFLLSGFFVLGISAWHIVRKSHTEFFNRSFKLGAWFTAIMMVLVLFNGHREAVKVAAYQPEKFAAMEAHWETKDNAPMYVLAIPDEDNKQNSLEFLEIPGMLSFMAYGDFETPVKGLNDFPKDDIPPVAPVFYGFRFMVITGMLFMLLSTLAFIYRKRMEKMPWLCKLLTWNIPLPYLAIMAGWMVAEVGRQPWIVYKMMRTADAASPVPGSSVMTSLIAFIIVYTILGILDVFLIRKYALRGPAPIKTTQK